VTTAEDQDGDHDREEGRPSTRVRIAIAAIKNVQLIAEEELCLGGRHLGDEKLLRGGEGQVARLEMAAEGEVAADDARTPAKMCLYRGKKGLNYDLLSGAACAIPKNLGC